MRVARARAGIGLAAGLGLALAACAPQDPLWLTPAGVPLGQIDCTSPAPLEGGKRAEVCLARVIDETPAEIARCERDGGSLGPISPIDKRFACTYRKPAGAG